MILERTIFSFTPYHGIVLMVVMLSFLFSHLLVQTSALHGRWSMDGVGGIQKVHRRPTPRIGGIAIALAMLFVWLTLEHGPRLLPFSGMTHGTALRLVELLEPVLIAAIPAFAAGLAEDLTKRVGVAQRLWASLVSGLLLSLLTGVSIQRLDLPGVDALFMAGSLGLFLSYALTAFAAGGLCHAINMIDGVNGLASSAITIMLGAFAWLAWTVDDVHLAWIATSGAAAALGFFLVNFPRGAIFLGDGGAYLLGFLLAAVALALPARNPNLAMGKSADLRIPRHRGFLFRVTQTSQFKASWPSRSITYAQPLIAAPISPTCANHGSGGCHGQPTRTSGLRFSPTAGGSGTDFVALPDCLSNCSPPLTLF